MSRLRPRTLDPQILLLLGALLLWAIRPSAFLGALVAAYGVAWLLLNYLGRGLKVPTSSWWVWGLAGLALAGPLLALHRRGEDLGWEEGLRGLGQNLEHRLRLEKLPALAPGVVFTDHPQTFYLHAPKAQTASLELGSGVLSLAGLPLGHGLFRVDYDPRAHGSPKTEAATVEATLVVDGRGHRRPLRQVRWQCHPRWLASAPEAGRAAAASEETDEVVLLSRDGRARRVPVGDGPTDAVFLDGGERLAVSHRYGSDLWVLDGADGEVLQRILLGPFQVRLAVSPEGDALAVAVAGESPGIELFALPSLEPLTRIPLPREPDWLAFGPHRGVLVYSHRVSRSLYRVDTSAKEAKTLALSRPAVTLAATSDGRRLYVAVTDYRPDGEAHRGNHFIQDQILAVDVEAWEVAGQLLTARRTPRQSRAGNVDSGVSPMGITPRRDGSLLVAFAGSAEVWHLDEDLLAPPRVVPGPRLELSAPHGVADLGEGYWAASSPGGGALAIYSPEDELLHFVPVSPSDGELAAAQEGSLARQDLALRAGELAFYETTRAGISCQSCHLHGGTDESPHDIGQTPLLPTLTVKGVAGTSPYLRDGSFPRVRDLDDHLARILYRGYARNLPERRYVLETFVESLPRSVNPRRLQGFDDERMAAGVEAFTQARCQLCHTFPAFTNLSQHPVRSLFPRYGEDLPVEAVVDTPSLLSSHEREHFLQDGRAHSLEEVMGEELNPADRHGATAALGEARRSALVYLLESL